MLVLIADDPNRGPLIALVVVVYLLPSIVAVIRSHRNVASIVVLNVLLGWTLVGWCISMVWAVSAKPEVDVRIRSYPRERREPTRSSDRYR